MTVSKIDLNADLGEHPGDTDGLVTLITSANIAGGGHAGGGALLDGAVLACVEHGVRVGAHPSYPDRDNFGRVSLRDTINHSMLFGSLIDQILMVRRATEKHGTEISHVKAHGALYNDAMIHRDIADLFLAAVIRACPEGTPVLGQPDSVLETAARELGVPFLREGFMDRAYTAAGTLVPRSTPGAVLHDANEVTTHVLSLAVNHSVTAITGETVPVTVDSICVHADTAGAAEILAQVRSTLESSGLTIAPMTGATSQQVQFTVAPFGDMHAIITGVSASSNVNPAVLANALNERLPEGTSARPGLDTVLVSVADPTVNAVEVTQAALSSVKTSNEEASPKTVTFQVTYNGADLDDVATTLKVSRDDIIKAHTSVAYRVALIGFAPGFPYLIPVDGDSEAAVLLSQAGRLATPRTQVPAGSVAIASGMSAIYPNALPGGWNLIGHITEEIFNPHNAAQPSLLNAGDLVQFQEKR